MIFLTRLKVKNFKGIKDLTCEFDDFTTLVGMNNSGKTSLLQAAYLVFASMSTLLQRSQLEETNSNAISASVSTETIGRLGIPSINWLVHSGMKDMAVTGWLWNDLSVLVEATETRASVRICQKDGFSPATTQSNYEQLVECKTQVADFLIPPGRLAAFENMETGENYRGALSQGRGVGMWRNEVWWRLQKQFGHEQFQEVKKYVQERFPSIELQPARLGDTSPAPILIEYSEGGSELLDIAQSGAGLQTFLSLTQSMRNSRATLLLLDEPDSHLHASQQALVADMLAETAINEDRQVIITTHSSEMIGSVPRSGLRWVTRTSPQVEEMDISEILAQLGVTANTYFTLQSNIGVIVYVEGKDDKQFVERVIDWGRKHTTIEMALPTTTVVRHQNGRFDMQNLHGIGQTIKECGWTTRVVGVGDLDFFYEECPQLPPSSETSVDGDAKVSLVTLPCKEFENLFCDPAIISEATGLPIERVTEMLREESMDEGLIRKWYFQVRHRISNRLMRERPQLDISTADTNTSELLDRLTASDSDRYRLVSGKQLLARMKVRVKAAGTRLPEARMIVPTLSRLPAGCETILRAIFPTIEF